MNLSRRRLAIALCVWILGSLSYAAFLKAPISRAYVDFGDGNYQYIGGRLTQGVRLYTEILSPQPPFHLWIGACLETFSNQFGVEPLLAYRWFTTIVRVLTSALVGAIALRLFRSAGTAAFAGLVFYLLPEGYRWSQGYQSEHIELALLLAGFLCCLFARTGVRSLGAVLAAASLWTNMSSLPFALLILAFASTAPALAWGPVVSFAGTVAVLFGVCYWQAGPAYLENVWSNQVASIPGDWRVWVRDIAHEGGTIIGLEGPFILLALMGMWAFLKRRFENPERPLGWSSLQRGFIVLYGIASVGSAVYVVKGGTVDYIFMLAEGAIAVFSARALALFRGRTGSDLEENASVPANLLRSVSTVLLTVGTLTLLVWVPLSFNRGIYFQSLPNVDLPDTHEGRVVEYSDVEVRTILKIIDHLSEPGDTIWAPPFFAALSKRPIALDLSETYLWYVRWQHSVGGEDAGVEGMISGLTETIENREPPLLLLNSRTGQWGQLIIPDLALRLPGAEGGWEIRKLRDLDPRLDRLQSALEEGYHPILSGPGSEERLYLQGMNERLEIWVPRDRPRILPPWSRVGFE